MKTPSNLFTRSLCSEVYSEYVETYLQLLREKEYCGSVVLFVYSHEEEAPTVVPVEMTDFSPANLVYASEIAYKEQGEANLELIIYSQFSDTDVVFGGRDSGGNTIHNMYSISPKSGYIRKRKGLPFFNMWVPPIGSHIKVPFERHEDLVLTKLATNYSVINSIPEPPKRLAY